MKQDGCPIPIKEERSEVSHDQKKDELSKKSIKAPASTLYGLAGVNKMFQKTRKWRRMEKNLKNSDRSAGERNLKTKKLEELYSIKTMLRMLYQAGIIMLRQTEEAVGIHYLSFPFSWMKFTGSLSQNQKDKSEEAGLIEVAECFILFEEFIKSRKILVTSPKKPTSSANPSPGEGT
jgi:hypothetical protein